MASASHPHDYALAPPLSRSAIEAHRPAYHAYVILHVAFAALPIVAGADKFSERLVDWEIYLAPAFTRLIPFTPDTIMQAIGVVEMVAGLLVAFAPRIGGYVVAAWLWAIVANLLMTHNFYDIALRDFGLSFGALALARLAAEFDHAAANRSLS